MKIRVFVKTRSRQNKIVKIDENTYQVNVTQAPEKGKANQAVIKLLSKFFNKPKNRIELTSGFKSQIKIIKISA